MVPSCPSGLAVGKYRLGPISAVPGTPSSPKTTPMASLKAIPLWLHTLAGGAALSKGGGLGAQPERVMGLMGWVQVQDEPGHTAPLWHRASAHKNWIPPCSSPLPRDSVSAQCCTKAHRNNKTLTAPSGTSRKGWMEQGTLPNSLESAGLRPAGGVLMTVLDPREPTSSHSAWGNSPPPPGCRSC